MFYEINQLFLIFAETCHFLYRMKAVDALVLLGESDYIWVNISLIIRRNVEKWKGPSIIIIIFTYDFCCKREGGC